jgi:hypothetical protein
MKNQRIGIPEDDDHRVIPFRPRSAPAATPSYHAASHLPQPQRVRPRDESPEDFRHRMLANGAALAFTVALTVVGFWLATSIADMRRTQDCVLMGRRDCAPIAAPRD